MSTPPGLFFGISGGCRLHGAGDESGPATTVGAVGLLTSTARVLN
jgi:hypothetical protein